MKLPERSFVTESSEIAAQHSSRPLWFAMFSPSNGGKTFSALRVATGMQQVLGGDIHMIDTESGRGLHYKDYFKYQYTRFDAPYGSLDYLAAINHVVSNGARIVIIDQLSYEHEGDGGLLDFHEKELDRMAGDDWKKREAVKMLAWTKPKAARKQLIRSMLAMPDVAFVLAFRADETAKPVKRDGKTEVVQMGFMPIAGKPFVYEATVCALLMPGANGVPTWEPENVGERLMRKLPEQFKALFESTKGQPLSEAHGAAMAEWAMGGRKPTGDLPARVTKAIDYIRTRKTADGVNAAFAKCDALLTELDAAQDFGAIDRITAARDERLKAIQEGQ